ncbi:hypothetical protein QCN29_25820 [Streptomyces sp. HNM0663]|uniref:Uncharacterized protein n=1 Tax=Streptomyces chengmaiensis TaxID=3040919 RepID=A0ABT6HUT1_9ACTN|nr:hypothetical protein [Streptomyces chengmaiensis]MDH2392140.1 hypothetical protein [Streptomyces chengmaiensis]
MSDEPAPGDPEALAEDQRIPGWLVALITTAGGAAGTWWAQR